MDAARWLRPDKRSIHCTKKEAPAVLAEASFSYVMRLLRYSNLRPGRLFHLLELDILGLVVVAVALGTLLVSTALRMYCTRKEKLHP